MWRISDGCSDVCSADLYLRLSGRSEKQIALVEAYARAQGLWHEPGQPEAIYSSTIGLDMSEVQPSLAGPKRPQDRVLLSDMKANFHDNVGGMTKGRKNGVGCAVNTLDAEGGGQPRTEERRGGKEGGRQGRYRCAT